MCAVHASRPADPEDGRVRPGPGRRRRACVNAADDRAAPGSDRRPARGRGCSVRTEAAITRCVCSVVAIRYRVSKPSASRSPLPASTPIITDLLAHRSVRRAVQHRMYRSRQQRPGPEPRRRRHDHGHKRPRLRGPDRNPLRQPAALTPALSRESAGHHAGPAVVGRPCPPLSPRSHRPGPRPMQRPGPRLHPATDRHRRGRTLLVGLCLRNQALGERTGRVVAPALGRRSSHPHCSRSPALGSSVVHICLRT
jgi:hypothetical protein